MSPCFIILIHKDHTLTYIPAVTLWQVKQSLYRSVSFKITKSLNIQFVAQFDGLINQIAIKNHISKQNSYQRNTKIPNNTQTLACG